MAPDHSAGIADEPAEIERRPMVGAVDVAPGRALVPGRDGALDGLLVQRRGALDHCKLGLGLDHAGGHHRVVAVGNLDTVDAEPEPVRHVVEGDLAACQSEFVESAADGAVHIEAVLFSRPADPFGAGASLGDEAVDVARLGFEVEPQHDGAERSYVLDPTFLGEERRQVVIGDHHDRMVRRVARQDDRIGARFVRIMRDAVEAGEVEDVQRPDGDDPVEPARLERVQQPFQIAELRRQRPAFEQRAVVAHR